MLGNTISDEFLSEDNFWFPSLGQMSMVFHWYSVSKLQKAGTVIRANTEVLVKKQQVMWDVFPSSLNVYCFLTGKIIEIKLTKGDLRIV